MNAGKILIIIAFLITVSIGIIAGERYLWNTYEAEKARSFQRYLSGFGLGATINPAWGFFNYDPRVDHVDETQLWPVPGGYSYSPDRGVSVSDIKEIIPVKPVQN
ncbi:MAG: hypothetical protein AABY42_09895 [Nitrospirota bacterium]